MTKRIMIVGPYGGMNMGDDLILHQILTALAPFDLQLTVSCSDPVHIARLFGVKTCSLLEYRRWNTESLRMMDQLDGVIIGGGEQLSEPRVINPLWGHLARTAHLCRVARGRGVPVMLWAVGLDQLRSRLSQALLRQWVFREGVTSCLRDPASVERARAIMRGSYDGLHLVADPAYDLPRYSRGSLDPERARHLGLRPGDGARLLIVPAYDKFVDLGYLEAIAAFARAEAARGTQIYGWTTDLQKGYDDILLDHPLWKDIPGFTWLKRDYVRPEEMAPLIAEFDSVVSARMHPVIIAHTQNVPTYMLARSAKMVSMMDSLNILGAKLSEVSASDIERNLAKQREARVGTCDERSLSEARSRAQRCVDHFRAFMFDEREAD